MARKGKTGWRINAHVRPHLPFRRLRSGLRHWTRDVELTSGRQVRLSYVPIDSSGSSEPDGMIRIHGPLKPSEMRELEALLAADSFLR